jgi:hypothetical protein
MMAAGRVQWRGRAVRQGSAVAVESVGESRMGVVVAAIREESERKIFYLKMLWSNASDRANGITVLGRSDERRDPPTLAYRQSDALPTTFPLWYSRLLYIPCL